jgi:ABC-type nitrate/sulfonate/bicarbonate transport system substrate-binding protein
MRLYKWLSVLLAASLLAVGCGGGSDAPESSGSGGGSGLSQKQVRLAIDNDDFMNQIAWMVADERFWPGLGFTEKAYTVATDEYIAGLLGGDVWMAQGESDVVWSALGEGSVDLKIVGVEKDTEAWFLGARKGVDKNNLAGKKISGGDAGDRNNTVGRHALNELGINPDSLEWVSIGGGSDDRLQALIAGQIDVAVLQPRHLLPLEEAGGEMFFQKYQDSPQEVWVTTAEVMEKNKDAVCAYLQGRIAAKQWISQGGPPNYDVNKEATIQLGRQRGLDPTEGDLDEWVTEMEKNWSLDGGAPADAFERWNQDMIANKNVPEGFNWREHTDLSCLWQAQDALKLPRNPTSI